MLSVNIRSRRQSKDTSKPNKNLKKDLAHPTWFPLPLLKTLAREVLEYSSPTEDKAIASRVLRHLHQNWHSIKLCVMKDILHAKADYCDKFKRELLNSGRNAS